MAATPSGKTFAGGRFAGLAQFLEAKKDSNFELKKSTDVVQLTNDILQMFYDVDSTTNNQKMLKGAENGFFLSGMLTLGKKDGPVDLGLKNRAFAYFLLSTSGEEFHNMFLRFFHEFDHDKDYVLSEREFKNMLNFFCKKENVGIEKIEKVFKKLFPMNFKSWNKLDKILDKPEEHELGINLANGVFQQLKCIDKQSYAFIQNKQPVVEYVKMLPLFTALYAQLIQVRINKRKENLEMTRGVDELGDKIRLSESSLCDKFERLGLVYDKDEPVILTYRDIENALILFKNYYTSNFGQEQLNLVLGDIQQKYKYSKKRGDFIKPPLFDQKFLTYLAFKVSIHGICHFIKSNQAVPDQIPIIQEFVYWNIVIHADKFTRTGLAEKFVKFAKKNPNKQLDQLFSLFIVKVLPLIPRQIGQNILNNYFHSTGGHVDIHDFANRLYNLLIEQAELKLENYLKVTFEKITQQSDQMAKAESVRRQSVLERSRHHSKPSQEKFPSQGKPQEKTILASPNLAPIEDVSYAGEHSQDFNLNESYIDRGTRRQSVASAFKNTEQDRGTRRQSVMTAYKNEIVITDQDRSKDHSRSMNKVSDVPSVSEFNSKAQHIKLERIPIEVIDAPRESLYFERKTAKDKTILTARDQSQSGIMLDRDGRPEQDYLNSCFIMETFLHNFLYEKTLGNAAAANSKKKKETTASRRMSVHGKKSSRRMTKLEGMDFLNQENMSREDSVHISPERHTTQGAYQNNYQIQVSSGYQQAAQQEEFDLGGKMRRTRVPIGLKKKKDSYHDMDEFEDVDINSDAIFFTKKDMQKKQKGRCACGMESCNMF